MGSLFLKSNVFIFHAFQFSLTIKEPSQLCLKSSRDVADLATKLWKEKIQSEIEDFLFIEDRLVLWPWNFPIPKGETPFLDYHIFGLNLRYAVA